MEKRDGSKVVALVALVVAVVALSVGFAAYTASLNITNAQATVKSVDEFSPKVNFTTDSTKAPKCYKTGETSTNVITTGYSAGTASAKAWDGISVPLTSENGYDVTCEAQIDNASDYIAYLKTIESTGGTNSDGKLACASVATSGSEVASNVSTICNGTTVTVTVGSATADITAAAKANSTGITGSSIVAKSGSTNGTQTVLVRIHYAGTVAADGDIKITIPTIRLDYSTVQ